MSLVEGRWIPASDYALEGRLFEAGTTGYSSRLSLMARRTLMLPSSLTVSVVTYRPDLVLLERCLRTLVSAIAVAQAQSVLGGVAMALIDNSEDPDIARTVSEVGERCFAGADVQMNYRHGHANIGYGIAHNLMLHGTGGDYQLVLNPDVELAQDALANAIRWLDAHSEVGLVAPAVTRPDGTPDYLCKRYPAVIDLLVRGFLPRVVQRLWRARLDRYELRDRIDPVSSEPVRNVPLVSGCCMLVKRHAIDATGGFDPAFFLYFEDFDWSLRLARITQIAYLPSMRAVHHGGRAAHKGWKHVLMFMRSGFRFYSKHGWRWI